MIRLENITKRYPAAHGPEEHEALAHVDLTVAPGELVCLLGPSGCGKTTLLNLAAGFVHPTAGRVRFDGRPVDGPGPERGVVFQEATLFPWLTVRGNVEFGLRRLGIPADERSGRAQDALRLVGLAGFEKAYPHALSGGMRQRAALARVLVLEPKALLMDEPFGALDANSRERLQDELLRIWQARRRTVLFVTHSVEEAAYLADRVVLLGPPPRSLRGEVIVELARPRDRAGDGLRRVTRGLRSLLDEMPCCLPE
jgi:NitT/TauT family transport system ATP-binding protein